MKQYVIDNIAKDILVGVQRQHFNCIKYMSKKDLLRLVVAIGILRGNNFRAAIFEVEDILERLI